MAYVDLYPGTDFPYVSVSFAVGSKEHGTKMPAPNLPTDKMLVYYLLWYIHTLDLLKIYKPLPLLPREMEYTQNNDYISSLVGYYQKRNRSVLYNDARVDKVRSPSKTSITKTTYTILHLYHTFEWMLADVEGISKVGEIETIYYITDDPLTPPQLKYELLKSMNIAPSGE